MSEKTQINVSVLLPSVENARDACLQRLTDLLKSRDGIENAHILEASEEQPNQVCIHFDSQQLALGDIRELARRAGAELDQQFGHILLRTAPMHAHRATAVAARLQRHSGVLEAVVSPDGVVRVEFDRHVTDASAIRDRLGTIGLSIANVRIEGAEPPGSLDHDHETAAEDHEHGHDHGGIFGRNSELVFAILSGITLLTGWLISFSAWPEWIPWCLYLAAYGFGGFYTTREAIEKILSRRFEIDFLMLVAAAGAASLGEWAEGALLLFLFSLGHSLEHYAMGRARRAIEALAELAPQTALVRRNGTTQDVSVDQLRIGEIVIVKPNERISADGFVVAGESSVNQAPITGESVPVEKRPVVDADQAAQQPERLPPEHRVFAGTINDSGALEVQVTKTAAENTLARVVQLVNEAETRTSPTQQFTSKFERVFVPAVLALVVLLLFAPLILEEAFSESFYRAMAVLVAASPCALAIATPSAVLSGVARAARGGVLIKGGGPLETLGRLKAVAFDKTGTLTEGKPRLTDVATVEGVSEEELLRVAVAVEELSDHPLAAAVVRDGRHRLGTSPHFEQERTEETETSPLAPVQSDGSTEDAGDGLSPLNSWLPEASDLQSITGRGLRATVDGQSVFIGKAALFSEIEGAPLTDEISTTVEQLEHDGRTTMIVRFGDRYLGVLGLMDTPREAAKHVVRRLHDLGIRRMIMISGDNQRVADAVASAVGLDEARGDLMPDDKVEEIRQLRREGGVAMVGDGVNDAPAMANASVGIAMGAAGSDVALETADVALMADDLNHLPLAIGLSRQTSRIIRQNLWFSLGMVAFLIPATLFGLQMGPAVMLHEGSTLLVVFNALRLLRYEAESGSSE